jgi:serine/threonine protein kinase/Tfp pilus assembly protein PilF
VVVPLIYEEICQRQEAGEAPSLEEYRHRFPQWQQLLEVLFECQRLLGPVPVAPRFPETGEKLGTFHLLAEVGRGRHGRVFLATQPDLAHRLVVLKVVPLSAGPHSGADREHLSLARLQHPHIVPLLFVQEDVPRDLLLLCMPYLGGSSLARLLEGRHWKDPGTWGRQLLESLDQFQSLSPVAWRCREGPARQFLGAASVVQAVCWIGACLADALHYAHQQGLVHLDVKLSNVLLTADVQPMLLDFHLAREPLPAGGPVPEWLGGTRGCMPPEQERALAAVQWGQPLTSPVDARADIYSLGMLLHQLLASVLGESVSRADLRSARRSLDLGVGLADILGKCLAENCRDRYASAADLATDLRLHLVNQPLRYAGNRSWLERWQKWRRRRPHGVAFLVLLAAVLTSGGTALGLLLHQANQREEAASAALREGRLLLRRGQYPEALATLRVGLEKARALMGTQGLEQELTHQFRLAEQAQAAQELHGLADQIRFVSGDELLSPRPAHELETQCRALWDRREQIVERLGRDLDPAAREQIQADLLDLAILGADLRIRLASAPDAPSAHRDALKVLEQAETLLGTSAVLRQEQRRLAAVLGLGDSRPGVSDPEPRTAWEHCAVGRSLLRSGRVDEAATALARAWELDPGGLWTNFYLGQCAYRRQRPQEALMAFSACVVLVPGAAHVYFNRALVLTALGCPDQAQLDYDRALQRDSGLAPAALNRGLLHYQAGRLSEAAADLNRALDLGHDPDTVHYNLALIHLARHDPAAAQASLDRALKANPRHSQARQLRANLQQKK